MAKFRKKPVVIDAELFDEHDIPQHSRLGIGSYYVGQQLVHGIYTLEGTMTVSPGDWIITGVKGERYPCKPDIFEATYEPVNE
jgi:hypothetical protein